MIDTKSEEDMGWVFKSFYCRVWFTFSLEAEGLKLPCGLNCGGTVSSEFAVANDGWLS